MLMLYRLIGQLHLGTRGYSTVARYILQKYTYKIDINRYGMTRIGSHSHSFYYNLLCNIDGTRRLNHSSSLLPSTTGQAFFSGLPATDTKLMQYREPDLSGKLCPKCVPSTLTVSPSGRTRTWSQTTSESRKLGHPCILLSNKNWDMVRPLGATNNGLPVLES